MTASVVIPVLNDAGPLRRLMADLRVASSLDIVVVDGGSDDDSRAVAAEADAVYSASRGRAEQMRLGVEKTSRPWLWFLHADSRVHPATLAKFGEALGKPGWGWFDVRLDGDAWPFRVIEVAMNRRARATSIATGDQGIFVHRRLLEAVGGIPRQGLMEDVELCKRLRRLARPRPIAGSGFSTSSRRWQRDGIPRTVALMWWLRLRYFLGADADRLVRSYYP